jgi:hypothetical protein
MYEFTANSPYYSIISTKFTQLSLLIDVSVNLVKGDNIKIVEVDALGNPTGSFFIVTFQYRFSGDEYLNNGDACMCVCIKVNLGIGSMIIGSTFIVG